MTSFDASPTSETAFATDGSAGLWSNGTRLSPFRLGRTDGSADSLFEEASTSPSNRAHSLPELWRGKVVESLKKPWRRKQQQPSWDRCRTVELQEEEEQHIAQQRAHGLLFRWWWAIQGWLLAVSVGSLCFMTYVFIEVCVGMLSSVRFGFCLSGLLQPEDRCSNWVHWPGGIGAPIGFCSISWIWYGDGRCICLASE